MFEHFNNIDTFEGIMDTFILVGLMFIIEAIILIILCIIIYYIYKIYKITSLYYDKYKCN